MFVRKAAASPSEAPVPECSSFVENIRLGQKRQKIVKHSLITAVKWFMAQVPEPNALKQIADKNYSAKWDFNSEE